MDITQGLLGRPSLPDGEHCNGPSGSAIAPCPGELHRVSRATTDFHASPLAFEDTVHGTNTDQRRTDWSLPVPSSYWFPESSWTDPWLIFCLQ